jgi:hypothetical protein
MKAKKGTDVSPISSDEVSSDECISPKRHKGGGGGGGGKRVKWLQSETDAYVKQTNYRTNRLPALPKAQIGHSLRYLYRGRAAAGRGGGLIPSLFPVSFSFRVLF